MPQPPQRPLYDTDATAPRVLVVDDSPTMRALIRRSLEDSGIDVIGEAEDAVEADTMIKAYNPDAITLDVEMPGMNGLDYLEKLMNTRPMPVVMFSNLTQKGARQSIEALASGAFEAVGKPSSPDDLSALNYLGATLRAAVASNCVPRAASRSLLQSAVVPRAEDLPTFRRIVAIGASTGGVEALIRLLSEFPKACPPTLIAQHILPSFLAALVEKLDEVVRPTVRIAQPGEELARGTVYFAPTNAGHLVLRSDRLEIVPETNPDVRTPSIDALFRSVAREFGPRSVGLVLTGLGQDGARGLLEMRNSGALTFGQSEGSCSIYDMPKAAMAVGAVEREIHLRQMSKAILRAATQEPTRVSLADRASPALRGLS
ncbi:MAG: chemotaxis-specific protein-glutamate methyltransferase CheB [Litorimonas sp.]